MERSELERGWRALSDEVACGMGQWREQHPRVTLREIELALDERLAKLRAHMLEDAALASEAADWQGAAPGEQPVCPQCGRRLVARGKRERRLQTQEGEEVVLKRS